MARKTVLINVFDTAVAKNFFTPMFLDALPPGNEVRIVVVVAHAKLAEYQHDYAHPALEFIARPHQLASGWEAAALFFARNAIPTSSVRRIQKSGLDGTGTLSTSRYMLARCLWYIGHIRAFRTLTKSLLVPVFHAEIFDEIFERTQPDLAFASTMYAVDDIRFLRAARARGIATVGMVKSWDNLTSKDMIFIAPDTLIAHNNVVKDEAVQLHGYPEDAVVVVGVPQFDWYADPDFPLSKSALFERLGLNPDKKLITYAAIGLWLAPHERDIIAMLDRVVRGLAIPAQLLVRMHPAYPDEREALVKLFPHIAIAKPGSPVQNAANAWKADWKFTTDDVRELASTLRYSDVTINCGSTMILDAVCFDKPVICLGFDGAPEPNFWRSVRNLYTNDHIHKVLQLGGVRMVQTEVELALALTTYLQQPETDHDGRAKIRHAQIGELGQASARLANALLRALN